MIVWGGTYLENVVDRGFRELGGSGLRGAISISLGYQEEVELRSVVGRDQLDTAKAKLDAYGVKSCLEEVDWTTEFTYPHALALPQIRKPRNPESKVASLDCSAALVFGTFEEPPNVKAKRAVYDPQNPNSPNEFGFNGSTAEELALVLNLAEARAFTRETELQKVIDSLRQCPGLEVLIIKLGFAGAIVCSNNDPNHTLVRAFETDRVFSLGSGDVFSAIFAIEWAERKTPAVEAAQKASLATAYYCESNSAVLPENFASNPKALQQTGKVDLQNQSSIYLASPFFDSQQLWFVEGTRGHLSSPWTKVFSPYHDVGIGAASVVYPKDIGAIEASTVVYANLNTLDPGTIFEVGYAAAKGKPVVALAQSLRDEDLKMMEGAECVICDDYTTSVYRCQWKTLTQQ